MFRTDSLLFNCILSLYLLFLTNVFAKHRCVKVVGRIHCATDWDRHFDVKIKLMDKDSLPWENDDEMGHAISDEDGNFSIEGCADDFGSWNEPDPYLTIEHRCPEPGHTVSIPRRHKTVILERTYLPNVIFVESIRIDDDDSF